MEPERKHELSVRRVASVLKSRVVSVMVELGEAEEATWAELNDFLGYLLHEADRKQKRENVGAVNGCAMPGDCVQFWKVGTERTGVWRVAAVPSDGVNGYLLVDDAGNVTVADLLTGWRFA